MAERIEPWAAQFSLDELRYEVLRVCRKTDVVDLVAAFASEEDAEEYALEYVEGDLHDAIVRDRATAPAGQLGA